MPIFNIILNSRGTEGGQTCFGNFPNSALFLIDGISDVILFLIIFFLVLLQDMGDFDSVNKVYKVS